MEGRDVFTVASPMSSCCSGVTLATILASSLVLLLVLGRGEEQGPEAAILVGSVIACAAGLAGDNMQVPHRSLQAF
mgnify:CR=1 FL=1